jgi:hypothetical protein
LEIVKHAANRNLRYVKEEGREAPAVQGENIGDDSAPQAASDRIEGEYALGSLPGLSCPGRAKAASSPDSELTCRPSHIANKSTEARTAGGPRKSKRKIPVTSRLIATSQNPEKGGSKFQPTSTILLMSMNGLQNLQLCRIRSLSQMRCTMF